MYAEAFKEDLDDLGVGVYKRDYLEGTFELRDDLPRASRLSAIRSLSVRFSNAYLTSDYLEDS